MASDALRRWAGRLRHLVTTVRFLVTVAVLVVLVAAYTLAGFFLVPRLLKTYVPRYVQEQLDRRAEIGEVRLNPFLFKLEVTRFRLTEADGRPLLGFERLFVDFELSSLFRRAWTFAEIQLEAPRLEVVLAPDGRLNMADLIDAFSRGEPAEPPKPTAARRVLLQHLLVRNGLLSFTDRSGRTAQTATIEPIDLEFHDLTTLPGRRGPYAISATLTGGGVVDWEGEVSLVPLRSTGRLALRGFPLATAWRFVQEDIALAEPAGRLQAEGGYQFAYRDGTTALEVDSVVVAVAGLVLTRRGDRTPLLTLEEIRVAGGRGDLVSRDLTVAEISLSRGRVAATMARDGILDWQSLAVGAPAPAAASRTLVAPAPVVGPSTSSAPARPWRLAVDKVHVEKVALSFTDQSRSEPLGIDVADLTVDLSARLETGRAGLTGLVQDLGVKLADVAAHGAGGAKTQPLSSLNQVLVEGGRIDLGRRRIALSRVAVTGGATTLVRAAYGSLPQMKMLSAADQGKGAPRRAAVTGVRPASGTSQATPWTVTVAKLELGEHRLAVSDRSVTPAVALDVTGIKVSVRDVRTDGKKPFPFDASFRVGKAGRVTAKGRVAPDGSAADTTLSVARLALTPAQPYLARYADISLRAGEASTSGRLTYRATRGRAALTYTGSANVDGVQVVEASAGDPVVAWKSLHAADLRFGLGPDKLEIDEVRLTGLDGKLVIFKDKSVSVAKLLKPAGASASAPAPGGPSPGTPATSGTSAPAPSAGPATSRAPSPSPAAAAPGFPVVIERIRIDDSAMNFADLSLVLPFAAQVHALNGVIVGLGSDPATRATMKLEGRVDEFGALKVDGALSAFRPKDFTDVTVIFRNVPMSTLTPYSVTFAGRRIVAGTMNLNLQYKIDHSALVGENKVVLQKLQLGERVESPGAMQLPLDLAIAILSDAQGRIDIALPVRGNVDAPQFSYGHLIWQALVTVVKRIVASPFRALAGLFGGDAEKLQIIVFEPGSDAVSPPERQKLQRVAEVLGKRTRLKLTVHGGYETKVDGEALRSLHVRQALAGRLGVTVKPGEDPGPVAFDRVKSQRTLEALLTERAGSKALDEFQAGYEKRTGKKVDRANAILALIGRGSGDRAFYEALFRRLVELAPLGEGEITALGRRRGEAAARVLRERAGTAADRVQVGDTRAADRAEGDAVPTRLELGAVGS